MSNYKTLEDSDCSRTFYCSQNLQVVLNILRLNGLFSLTSKEVKTEQS